MSSEEEGRELLMKDLERTYNVTIVTTDITIVTIWEF